MPLAKRQLRSASTEGGLQSRRPTAGRSQGPKGYADPAKSCPPLVLRERDSSGTGCTSWEGRGGRGGGGGGAEGGEGAGEGGK